MFGNRYFLGKFKVIQVQGHLGYFFKSNFLLGYLSVLSRYFLSLANFDSGSSEVRNPLQIFF